jgi:hypothetical protein
VSELSTRSLEFSRAQFAKYVPCSKQHAKKAREKGTPPSTNRDTLIQHATYLFKAEVAKAHSPHFSAFKSLWIYTEDGKTAGSQAMYQPRNFVRRSTLACLSDPGVLFIHPQYFLAVPPEQHEKFSDWLVSSCKALTSLRICNFDAQGKPDTGRTKEFKGVLNRRSIGLFLEVMVSSWEQNFGLGSHNVPASVKILGGSKAAWASNRIASVLLSETFLPSKAICSLAPSSVPFLKVSYPEDPKWQELRHLGVMTEGRHLNTDFWLACLRSLLTTGPDKPTVVDLYKRLQLHQDYYSNSIR